MGVMRSTSRLYLHTTKVTPKTKQDYKMTKNIKTYDKNRSRKHKHIKNHITTIYIFIKL